MICGLYVFSSGGKDRIPQRSATRLSKVSALPAGVQRTGHTTQTLVVLKESTYKGLSVAAVKSRWIKNVNKLLLYREVKKRYTWIRQTYSKLIAARCESPIKKARHGIKTAA
ncbi:uncharacterized protein PHALS_09746 [Plasmopara halstedii]|uniref:Uncharacterized protein n=1 Tax=Plasmopara halstedii TaxID=4781 RepID=A0A0P1AFI9_PLAHL|nr:uncharacterized protein PHALS_09746 [Plasmopara halstedii]CEG39503.1 hypothetical protein PHALS_09746 [Plasmopara halstedii]|eukprot:XP_024575872.1 hypothetical protein PHALS_09746 [Plasmopara halstedii]